MPKFSSKISTICLICSKEFKVFPYLIKLGYGKYCGHRCRGLSRVGNRPWNKGLRKFLINGEIRWRTTRKGLRFNTGKTHFKKGIIPWNFGLKLPYICRPSQIGKIAGEKHPGWKGDKVQYRGLHNWIEKRLGKPKECTKCADVNAKRYHWHNISGKYQRDLNDWIRLCAKCHVRVEKEGKSY